MRSFLLWENVKSNQPICNTEEVKNIIFLLPNLPELIELIEYT
jgi:hypothetical protein